MAINLRVGGKLDIQDQNHPRCPRLVGGHHQEHQAVKQNKYFTCRAQQIIIIYIDCIAMTNWIEQKPIPQYKLLKVEITIQKPERKKLIPKLEGIMYEINLVIYHDVQELVLNCHPERN